jgi:hypothetical protein
MKATPTQKKQFIAVPYVSFAKICKILSHKKYPELFLPAVRNISSLVNFPHLASTPNFPNSELSPFALPVRRRLQPTSKLKATFRLSERRTSLLVLPSVRKVDEVNLSIKRAQNELARYAERKNGRRSQPFD